MPYLRAVLLFHGGTTKMNYKTIIVGKYLQISSIISFKKNLTEIMERSLFVRLDFRGTAHIDSSGLNILINLANKLKQKKGNLKLCNLKSELIDLMEIADVDKIATIE